jgi:hypothetical protein
VTERLVIPNSFYVMTAIPFFRSLRKRAIMPKMIATGPRKKAIIPLIL